MRKFWTIVAILVVLVASVLIFDPSRNFLRSLGLNEKELGSTEVHSESASEPTPKPENTAEPAPVAENSANQEPLVSTSPQQAQTGSQNQTQVSSPATQVVTAGLLASPNQSIHLSSQNETPYWKVPASKESPIITYNIQARLDVATKTVVGKETILYKNISPDIIHDLQFHLYMNAFRNPDSTYYLDGQDLPPQENTFYGAIDIQKALINGVDQTAGMRFIVGDDGHPQDRTVMAIPLATPLLPGEPVEIGFEFTTTLPEASNRTGYEADYFLVAQWFPKLGVWESRGMRNRQEAGWNTRHHHATTEFYSDFGNYQVELTLPANYQIGATGRLVSRASQTDGEHYRFEMERIHDFAFTASPDFLVYEKTFQPDEWLSSEELGTWASRWGVKADTIALQKVNVRLLLQKSHRNLADRYFKALFAAIKAYGLAYAVYPYDVLTMVDPPVSQIARTGGMEYPTFITLGTESFYSKNNLDLEDVTAHEFGHQYFQGMVASNEAEEAWLDEGFTNFIAARFLDRVYGKKPFYFRSASHFFDFSLSQLLGFDSMSEMDKKRLESFSGSALEPISAPAWRNVDFNHYNLNAYTKPQTLLYQLESEVGAEIFAQILHQYVQDWSFRHPSAQDFIAVVNRVSGRDLNWFFDELLYKTGGIDYFVQDVESRALPEPLPGEPVKAVNPKNRHHVRISKRGNLAYPVEIRVTFEDGEKVTEHFGGQESGVTYLYDRTPAISRVEIDPQAKLLLDRKRANNTYVAEPLHNGQRQWQVRILAFTQNLAQILAGGF